MDISYLLDLITDNQLEIYVEWLDTNPDATEEDSSDFLMDLLTDRQLEEYIETFEAPSYNNMYGACIQQDGSCFESTLSDCRALGGNFQGPGTSCGGYQQQVMMGSENAATAGKVSRPAAASDPRLTNDVVPKTVSTYLGHHPEVANLYDDDDASVMMKGIIIGCVIGAIGTIFGNVASELIMDKVRGIPDFSRFK